MKTRPVGRSAAMATMLVTASAAFAGPIEDARKPFDAKDYRSSLGVISAALTQPSSDRELRADLFLLRGECLLRLKSRGGALDAFRAAERATGDIKKASAAAAAQLLIEDSAGFTYTSPRGGQTFDIREPAARQQAVAAMYADRFEEIRPAAYREAAGGTLSASLTLLPELADVHALELTATGKDETVKPLLAKTAEQARGFVTEELGRIDRRVELITAQATDAVVFGEQEAVSVSARELTAKQRQELTELAQQLERLGAFCAKMRVAAGRIGGSGDAWAKLGADCHDQLARLAEVRDRG